MAKKSLAPKDGNRIWIELDKPRDKADAEKQCELANKMLRRLSPHTARGFWWSEREARYCLTLDEWGRLHLVDRQRPLVQLDHFGRDWE